MKLNTPLLRKLLQGLLSLSLVMTTGLAIANKPVKKNKPAASANKKINAPQPVQVQLRQNKLNNATNLRHFDKTIPPISSDNIFENSAAETSYSSNISTKYSIKHGCAKSTQSVKELLSDLNIRDDSLKTTFEVQVPGFLKTNTGSCLPYAISFDGQQNVQAFSLLNDSRRDKKTRLVTFNKSNTTGTYFVSSQDLSTGFQDYQEIELNLTDIVAYKTNKAIDSIPPELVWELASLVKEVYPEQNPKEKRYARVVFNAGDKNTWAQIISLEILDSTRTLVLANAFWVERDDIPGGFFNSNGSELEQNFWINPLNYTRISRGVGSFAAKGKRSKVVRQGKKNIVVTQFYTSYGSHQGIDFAAPTGTPIYAVANGKIIHYTTMNGYGNLVILEHPGNYKTYYAHLSAYNPELSVGSDVRRGMEIGYVGSTGHSTGPHLHFELRKNNVYQNPMAPKLELDLWAMRADDQQKLTRQIVLFSTF